MLTEEHKKKIKYLEQYKYLDKEIERKLKTLEDWKSKLYNVTATMSDMPSAGKVTDKISSGVATIDEIESNINQDIDALIELRKEIENKINVVEDLKLGELLKCRYLDCKTWEEIAYKNNYTWQWAHRLHERALDKINLD